MARPEAVRRVKSYSAATGHVYQYYFYEVQKVEGRGHAGTEYTYMVSADRKSVFPLRILVERGAVEAWKRKSGQKLSGTEEYAVAKMRLFQALDEVANIEGPNPTFAVDGSNLESLLAELNLLENESDKAES